MDKERLPKQKKLEYSIGRPVLHGAVIQISQQGHY